MSYSKIGNKNPNWNEEINAGAHGWLRSIYPKCGICEHCGTRGATDYAFRRHPLPYTRDREDYEELCRSCHMNSDGRNAQRDAAGKFCGYQVPTKA